MDLVIDMDIFSQQKSNVPVLLRVSIPLSLNIFYYSLPSIPTSIPTSLPLISSLSLHLSILSLSLATSCPGEACGEPGAPAGT